MAVIHASILQLEILKHLNHIIKHVRGKSVQATANCEQVDIYFHPFYRLNKRTILIIILLRDELQR